MRPLFGTKRKCNFKCCFPDLLVDAATYGLGAAVSCTGVAAVFGVKRSLIDGDI